MSKVFQIYEDDLAELERTIPDIVDAISDRHDNRMATQIRRLQSILTNVRWNYTPHKEVERIDAE